MEEASKNRKHLYEMFLNKIKESPLLFIKLWTIPPLLFHLSFKIFGSYTPAFSFFFGCVFMLALEAFLLFRVFDHQEEEEQQQPKNEMNANLNQNQSTQIHEAPQIPSSFNIAVQDVDDVDNIRGQPNFVTRSRLMPSSPRSIVSDSNVKRRSHSTHSNSVQDMFNQRQYNLRSYLQPNILESNIEAEADRPYQTKSQAIQIGGGPNVRDPIDLNVEVNYTEKHFVDPRDLPPALAALQEHKYTQAQNADIKRLFPNIQNESQPQMEVGQPQFQRGISNPSSTPTSLSANNPSNPQIIPPIVQNGQQHLTPETQYVQSQLLSFDDIQSMLMRRVLADDRELMKSVDKARSEEQDMLRGKVVTGSIEQDIMPEDEQQFDVEKIQHKFKLMRETNQRFQEFVQNFQQNEKFLSQKLRNMHVEFGQGSGGEAAVIEDVSIKFDLIQTCNNEVSKQQRLSLPSQEYDQQRLQNDQSRLQIDSRSIPVSKGRSNTSVDQHKPGAVKGDWVDISYDGSSSSNNFKSPMRSSDGNKGANAKNLPPIEAFIHETGYKHQVIYLSCESPILNQLLCQRKEIEREEAYFLEQIKQLQKQQEMSSGKLVKYQKKTLEALNVLVEQTKIYTKTKKEHDGDFKKILDAEIKYKMAYYTYADVKNKWMDRKLIEDDTRHMILNTQTELQNKLHKMNQDADTLFVSIVQNMAKFFIYINSKGSKQPEGLLTAGGNSSNFSDQNRISVSLQRGRASDLTQRSEIGSSSNQHLSVFKSSKGQINSSMQADNSRQSNRSISSNAFKAPRVFNEYNDLYEVKERYNIHHQGMILEQKNKPPRDTPGSLERQTFYPQYELRFEKLDEDESSPELDQITQLKSHEQLNKEFEVMNKYLVQISDAIDSRIQKHEPIGNFIQEVSMAFDEYLKNIISITFNEKGEEIIEYLADLEKEFRGQNETSFFSRFQRPTLDSQKQRSQSFKFITEIERLESLQAKIRQVVKLKLQNSHIVVNCKEHYVKHIDKLSKELKEGKRDFEKKIKIHNEQMKTQFSKLKDIQIKLEYVRLMKQPQQKDLTQKKIKLMMENKSLIMMQFMNERELPSEEMILTEIGQNLEATNQAFKEYQKKCKKAQSDLIQIEESAQTDLSNLQSRIIRELKNIYQEIQASFQSYSKGLDQYESMQKVIQETEQSEQQQQLNITYEEGNHLNTSEDLDIFAENPNQIITNTFRKQSRQQQPRTAYTEEGNGFRPTLKQIFHQNLEASFGTKSFSQSQIEKIQTEAFMNGKQHLLDGVNHTLAIFWEVWRSSQPFKNELMKTIYLALNKNRPKFLEEVNVTGLEQRGPPPKIFDAKHVTRLLSNDPDNEVFVDFSYQIQGPIIVTGDTTVQIDLHKRIRIPVSMKAIVNSLCAKMRIKFNTKNTNDNWIQWLGKPRAKISLEPVISHSFDIKHSLPRVKNLIDDFMQQQLCAFEKIPIDIPLQDEPIFVPRYSNFKNVSRQPMVQPTRSQSSAAHHEPTITRESGEDRRARSPIRGRGEHHRIGAQRGSI